MKSIKPSDISYYKRTEAKINTKKYKETPWSARMWDPEKRNWVKRKLDHTNKARAEIQAVEKFKDYFEGSIRSISERKHFKGVPTISDLIDFYHDTCRIRPIKNVREGNCNALKRVLTESGSKNPLAEPVTVITAKLFRNWFAERLAKRDEQCDGDVHEMDKEKHTLYSDWTKCRCIIKKEMIIAMEDEGWDKTITDHLDLVPRRVNTSSLYAPFDNEDFVRVPDELVQKTWDRFKSLKYKDPNAYIVFLLGFGAGLRFKETVFLRWQDLGEDEVRVTKHDRWKPKGQRNRTVKVPAFIVNEIREFEPEDKTKPFAQYCVSHPTPIREVTIERKGYRAFKSTITVGGKPCTKTERGEGRTGNKDNVPSRVNRILKELGWDETGLVTTGKKFHKLRAWNITQVIQNEDLYEAQKHAGHKKSSTTATYYDTGVKKKPKDYLLEGLKKGKANS